MSEGQARRRVYIDVQCIIGNGHMGTPSPVDRQTDTCENITFPQLRWRLVIMS